MTVVRSISEDQYKRLSEGSSTLGEVNAREARAAPDDPQILPLRQEPRKKVRRLTSAERASFAFPDERPEAKSWDGEQTGYTTMQKALRHFWGENYEDPSEWTRLGSSIVGGLWGANAGVKAGAPFGPYGAGIGGAMGGVLGTLAGTLFPEMAFEAVETVLDVAGLDEDGSMDHHQLTKEQIKQMLEGEMLFEAGTTGFATVGRGIVRTGARWLSGNTAETSKLADEAAELGVELAPFQAGPATNVGNSLINVFGRFPIIGSPAAKVARKAEGAIANFVDGVPSRFKPLLAHDTVSRAIYNNGQRLFKHMSGRIDEKYSAVYDLAESKGVRLRPNILNDAANALEDEILSKIPIRADGSPGNPSKVQKEVLAFIQNEIRNFPEFTLGQADETLGKMNDLINRLGQVEGVDAGRIYGYVAPLEQALKKDARENIFSNSGNVQDAVEVSKALTAVDRDFTDAMNYFFNTSAAKQFEIVDAKGLNKRPMKPSERATLVPMDKLYNYVVDLDSPKQMDELRRIIDGDTWDTLSTRVLADAFAESVDDATKKIDVDKLSRLLGLHDTASSRRKVMRSLLRDSPLEIGHIETLMNAARQLAIHPVADASMFVARRAVLAGVGSVSSSIFPWMALTAGRKGGDKGGALIGALLFFGGTRGLVGAVSNPTTARSLRTVLDKEAITVEKYDAFIALAQGSVQALIDAGEYTEREGAFLMDSARHTASDWLKENRKTPK